MSAPGASASGSEPLGPALSCPHAERCPGCPLIGLPYAAGATLKAQSIERALRRHPDLDGIERSPGVAAASEISAYRLRAKLVIDATGRLGLFEAGSHEVLDLPGCRVLAPEVQAVAAALRALLPLEIQLRGVDLRSCDRGVLVCLITEGEPDAQALERVRELLLAQLPGVAGLALNIARPGAVQLLGNELRVLAGNRAEPHHLGPGEPWHYASHGAFTQVHAGQTARLHARVEQLANERLGGVAGRQVLELYAGSGALALRLAARGARVTAVEAFAPALARISQAAHAQGLAVEAWAGDAEVFLHERAGTGATAPDVVLVNPPRRGLSPAVRAAIGALRPRLISYVSCHPETLARDLVHFGLLGYATARVEGFDMIPLSDAVECLAVLEPAAPPAPRVLFEDAVSVALDKRPFEPTTPQGESSSSLLERAREALGLPELTPVHRLDAGTSGVCWFARAPGLVAELAAELASGDKTYVALARGITRAKGKIARPLLEAGKRREALTRYRRRAVVGGHSVLELFPEHGRKHQLRRHLASIGHPILGDVRYGHPASNQHASHRHGLDRPFLHCASLRVARAGRPLEIQAPLAGDLDAVLASLASSR
jgi:tRNA/tmRNA/rRNA uracil-C5-methylase (TrmA/RlmC/RlmD family)/23S rRNA-/tRNA-specific pseudouridylate synthase